MGNLPSADADAGRWAAPGAVRPIGDYAIEYALIGAAVFPCRPGGKEPLTEHGFKDATCDFEQVWAWWRKWPDANIGHPTGDMYDVLDLDRRPGAQDAVADTLPRLRDHGLLAGCVGMSSTRNGGRHLYFPASGLRCSSIASAGVDLKAIGGFILLPPSRVPSDYLDLPGCYAWLTDWRDEGIPVQWGKIRDLLQPKPRRRPAATASRQASLDPLLRAVEQAAEGNRNRLLNWACWRALAEGTFDEQALMDSGLSSGLPESEVRKTIASAVRAHGGAA